MTSNLNDCHIGWCSSEKSILEYYYQISSGTFPQQPIQPQTTLLIKKKNTIPEGMKFDFYFIVSWFVCEREKPKLKNIQLITYFMNDITDYAIFVNWMSFVIFLK